MGNNRDFILASTILGGLTSVLPRILLLAIVCTCVCTLSDATKILFKSSWKEKKSKEQWLICRDLNIKFFHASTINCRRYNSISFLTTENDSWLSNRDEIGNYFVDYFSKIFPSSNLVLDDDLNELIFPLVPAKDNSMLCKTLDKCEIFQAISQLGKTQQSSKAGWNV